MTDSAQQVEGRNGGASGEPQERRPNTMHAQAVYSHALAYEYALVYTHARASISLAVKGSGLLALLLSTVVLLGGFVSSLQKTDFFCITVVSMIQAAGIFKDWERSVEYLRSFVGTYLLLMAKVFEFTANSVMINWMGFLTGLSSIVVIFLLSFVASCVQLMYVLGPLACAAISSLRIAKLNHGNRHDGTDSFAYMMAALNIFYSLVIFQEIMFVLLLLCITMGKTVIASHLLALEQLPEKWGHVAIARYISDVSAKCRKDPLSIKGMDMVKYAAELLDSESQEDYLYGARLLSAFVNKGQDVSWVLLPSTYRIQRLIESLWISRSTLDEACVRLRSRRNRCFAVIGGLNDKKEIRELAATILADVAAHIDDLSKYPGAMRCISSLLQDQEETSQTYRNRNSNKQVPDDQRPGGALEKGEHYREIVIREEEPHIQLLRHQKRMKIREHRHRHKREGGTSNELVQQGLTILERLASNSNDNRRIICSSPGLLPKITAPIYSATLLEDVKAKTWAGTVTRCLKVVCQLIRSPDSSHEIFSNVQALTNLKSILELGNNEADHQELQLVAMAILTELSLDLSTNLTDEIKKVLIKKQLQLFLLANGDGATIAGRTLVSLSTNSERNSALIMNTQDGIIGRLTEILDDRKNIMQRTIASEIMANLCAYCNVDNTIKEMLLPKVFREIMSIKLKLAERQISVDQNEPPLKPVYRFFQKKKNEPPLSQSPEHEEWHNISRLLRLLTSPTWIEEISDQEREEQEAFLSLAQVICDKLNIADLDGAIRIAFRNQNNASVERLQRERLQREAFVDMLKTTIDINCHATADCLRIVKLCGQIAKSAMRCKQYVEIFRNKGFKSSLSDASKTMSEFACFSLGLISESRRLSGRSCPKLRRLGQRYRT